MQQHTFLNPSWRTSKWWGALCAVALLTACSAETTENETTTPTETATTQRATITSNQPLAETLPNLNLLEEKMEVPQTKTKSDMVFVKYTGQQCPNCTVVERIANRKWLNDHPEIHPYFHSVAMHCEPSDSYQIGSYDAMRYKDREGEKMYGKPHCTFNNSFIKAYMDAPVLETINRAPQYQSALIANRSGERATIKYRAIATDPNLDPKKEYRIIFWLIEKEIKALQLDYEGYGSNYYSHHDVLKKALNGLDGQAYQIGTTISAELDLSRRWEDEFRIFTDLSNCYIMAILTDNANNQYVSVAKADVALNNPTGIVRIKR